MCLNKKPQQQAATGLAVDSHLFSSGKTLLSCSYYLYHCCTPHLHMKPRAESNKFMPVLLSSLVFLEM